MRPFSIEVADAQFTVELAGPSQDGYPKYRYIVQQSDRTLLDTDDLGGPHGAPSGRNALRFLIGVMEYAAEVHAENYYGPARGPEEVERDGDPVFSAELTWWLHDNIGKVSHAGWELSGGRDL